MLYNRDSFRLVTLGIYQRLKAFFSKSADPRSVSEKKRSLYDVSSRGEAAPHTDFVSKTDVRRMFREFSRVKIDIRNFDDYFLLKGKIKIRRQTVLNSLGRIWGLDLYITAIK